MEQKKVTNSSIKLLSKENYDEDISFFEDCFQKGFESLAPVKGFSFTCSRVLDVLWYKIIKVEFYLMPIESTKFFNSNL